ncbi:MAG: RIP metalloprotease RseP [Clostridia bacterium]|nr:RIP metalloprotease RseP [Clostridia bacterium]
MVIFKILIALLIFGVLIFVHELGHFLMAKACGVRVNEFALGMGPKLVSFGKKETTYSLRLLPLGGFCAMEGEDEDSDDPRAFGNKKVWQRILIVVAGVVMNFLFGYLILLLAIGCFNPLSGGESLLGTTTVLEYNQSGALSEACGLETGDIILTINDVEMTSSEAITEAFRTDDDGNVSMTVARGEETHTLPSVAQRRCTLDGALQTHLDFQTEGTTVTAFVPPQGSMAMQTGLQPGDTIEEINGRPVISTNDITIHLQSDEDLVVPMKVRRTVDGEEQTVWLEGVTFCHYTDNGMRQLIMDFSILGEQQTFWNTFSHAAKTEVSLVTSTWCSLLDMVTGRYGLNQIAGPVGTVDLVGNVVSDAVGSVAREDFYSVFMLIALISVNLGVMNLLPIPALDGGRLLFLIVEAIIRRPIPKKFEGMVHLIGFGLLILFMIVITFNDIVRLFTA